MPWLPNIEGWIEPQLARRAFNSSQLDLRPPPTSTSSQPLPPELVELSISFVLHSQFLRPLPIIILSTLLISPTPCAQVQNKQSSFDAVSLETFCKQTISILQIYLSLACPRNVQRLGPDNLLEDAGRRLLHSLFPILGPLPGGVVRHISMLKWEKLKIVKKRKKLLFLD